MNLSRVPSPILNLAEGRNFPFLIIAACVAILGGAFYFQYVVGLSPCVLCLYQRVPYYVVIALMALSVAVRGDARFYMGFLALAVIAFYVNAAIAAYHVGVEYKWWPGPDACAMPGQKAQTVEQLLAEVEAQKPVRCDEVQWRFLGLSMAAYNGIFSLILADLCALAALVKYHGTKKAN